MGRRSRRNRKPGPVRLCHVTTSDASLARLFAGQHRCFVERGYEVWGAALPNTGAAPQAEAEGLRFVPVIMSRRFGIMKDFRGLVALYRLIRRIDFDIVEASTLKGGFLGMLSAWLARVPVRVFTLRGAAYDTSRGIVRWVVKQLVRWPCRLSHRVLPICHELRRRCDEDSLCDLDKVQVVLAGSSNGLNLGRYTLTDELRREGAEIRRSNGIPADAVVVGIVARLKIEKGICELIAAFRALERRWPRLWLLVVGDFEVMHDPVPVEIAEIIRTHPRIRHVGFQDRTEPYYAAMDVFAMPSHREGFGNAIIEASAMELPVITSDTMGCREAALNGETGILVPVKNVERLTEAIDRLLSDPELCARLGQRGRRRVEEVFDQRKFWPALEAIYRELLRARGLPAPTADDRNESMASRGVAAAS